MQIPKSPPAQNDMLSVFTDRVVINFLLSGQTKPVDRKGRYLHWDELRFREPPTGLTLKQYWGVVKIARQSIAKELPFRNKNGDAFTFAVPDTVSEMLHRIDRWASGSVGMSEPITNPHTRDFYLINALMDEAITSSQLEGAATTRDVAKKMLRQKRKPKDRSERMILNNYEAIGFIRSLNDTPLTPEIVLELHRIVTRKTLANPDDAGRLRTDDTISVIGANGKVLHQPPLAKTLPARLKLLCDFANGKPDTDFFIHPVIRAILLHFTLAYDHPFVDGNGRTARALFYWAMIKHGYWLTEFLSISQIIKQGPSKYARAFLFTETDANDATYFIIHQLDVIQRAIKQLYNYLERKTKDVKSALALIEKTKLKNTLNHRQVAILDHALRHPIAQYTIQEHQNTHRIAYQTARTDLSKLAALGLLLKTQDGISHLFLAPPDLKERLERGLKNNAVS